MRFPLSAVSRLQRLRSSTVLVQRTLPAFIARDVFHWSNRRSTEISLPFPSSPRRFLSTSTSSSTAPKAPTNSAAVPRTAISFLGAVNAGKSVLMNLLSQTQTSIVHDTAGTTTDPKICAMELHGRIGPVRLFDTPGINEVGELGSIKRERALQTVGQCDVAVVVVDPFAASSEATSFDSVVDILMKVKERQAMNQRVSQEQPGQDTEMEPNTTAKSSAPPSPIALMVYNLRQDQVEQLKANGGSISILLEELEAKILDRLYGESNDDKQKTKQRVLPPSLAVDFTNSVSRERVIQFLETYADPRPNSVELLPDWLNDTHDQGFSPSVFLNIPMDQQTPSMRLLRPQVSHNHQWSKERQNTHTDTFQSSNIFSVLSF